MKLLRSSFFCFSLFFPFFCFSYTVEEIRDRVRGAEIYSYDSNWSLVSLYFNGRIDSVVQAFKTQTIALECSSAYLIKPDIDDTAYFRTNSYSTGNITRPVFDVNDKYFYISTFSELPPIFKFAQSLFANGYDGAGFVSINRYSPYEAKINFNYSLAVADIASSTNLVFHKILLNHLSSISSSVNNIDSNVSTISSALLPSLNHIEQINSGISSNVTSISSNVSDISVTLHGTQGYITNIDGVVSSVPSYLLSVTNFLSLIHDDNSSSDMGALLGDDTSAWNSMLDYVQELGYFNAGFVDELKTAMINSDPSSPSYDSSSPLRRSFLKSYIGSMVASRFNLNGLFLSPPNNAVRQSLSQFGSAFNKSVDDGLGDVSYNIQRQNQLNRDAISDSSSQIAKSNQAISDSINYHFSYNTPPSTNRLPFTVFVTNHVTRPLTNSIDRQTNQLITNSVSVASNIVTHLMEIDQNLSDGISVRIAYPLDGDPDHVNVHDQAVEDAIMELKDIQHAIQAQLDIVVGGLGDGSGSLSPSNSFDISEWLERWDRWAGTSTFTNLLHLIELYYTQYNDLFTDFSSDRFSSPSAFLSSNTVDRVSRLGGFDGSYWNFQVATGLLQSDFYSLMFDFYNEVADVLSQFHDPNTGQPFTPRSALRSIVGGLPSPTAMLADVGSFTNSYNLSYVLTMSNFLASANSQFTSTIDSTFRDSSLPGTVRLFTFNDQSFEIPLGPLSPAFGYLRTGLAFGYSVLLIILLPKYVLFWLRMYSKTFLLALSTSRFRKH